MQEQAALRLQRVLHALHALACAQQLHDPPPPIRSYTETVSQLFVQSFDREQPREVNGGSGGVVAGAEGMEVVADLDGVDEDMEEVRCFMCKYV